MKKSNTVFNWVIIAITLLVIVIMAANTDISQFKAALADLNYSWLALGFLAVVISWMFDALTIKNLLPGITGKKAPFKRSIKYSMVGLFYMALSPFGSAGQPMQMVYMSNDGIPVGKTTAVATIKFFTDKIAVVIIFITFLLLSGGSFFFNHTGIFWLSILAFVMNLVILASVFLLIIKPVFAGHFLKGIVRLLSKIKLVKHTKRAFSKIDTAISDYSKAAEFILSNKRRTALLSLLSIIRRMLLLVIPYVLLRAFGFTAFGIIEILAMNVFMSLAITLMPTPGGSIAAEGSFSIIYAGIFGAAIIPAVIIWRLLTYYLVIVSGSIMILFIQASKMLRQRKSNPPKLDKLRRAVYPNLG